MKLSSPRHKSILGKGAERITSPDLSIVMILTGGYDTLLLCHLKQLLFQSLQAKKKFVSGLRLTKESHGNAGNGRQEKPVQVMENLI